MFKKCSCLLVVGLVMLTIHMPKAEAMVVYDPSNFKNTFATELHTFATQANTLLMQKQAYDNFRTNLTRIADSLFDFNTKQIGLSLGELMIITHPPADPRLGDVSLEYDRLQREWDTVYNIEAISNADNSRSAHDYAAKALQMMEYTRLYTQRAKVTQGVISQLDTEKNGRESAAKRLVDLMAIAKGAPGTLAAQQAGQEIDALQAEQMMRMQYLMGTSQHAQAAHQAEIAIREEMAQDSLQRYYNRNITTYTMDQMKGRLAGLGDLD